MDKHTSHTLFRFSLISFNSSDSVIYGNDRICDSIQYKHENAKCSLAYEWNIHDQYLWHTVCMFHCDKTIHFWENPSFVFFDTSTSFLFILFDMCEFSRWNINLDGRESCAFLTVVDGNVCIFMRIYGICICLKCGDIR